MNKWQWNEEDEKKHGKIRHHSLGLQTSDKKQAKPGKNDKQFTLKHFEEDLIKGARDKSTKEAARVLLEDYKKTEGGARYFPRGLNPNAKEFNPEYKFKNKSGKKTRKSPKKSIKKLRESVRKLRKSVKKLRKSLRKMKALRKKSNRKSTRKSRK